MSGDSLNWIARVGVAMASRVNPLTSGPAAPLKADALLDSFGASLMPRKSLHQGLAGGMALLSAELIGRVVDHFVRKVAPPDSPLVWRLGVRAAIAAGGAAIAGISESDNEPTSRASFRSAGRLTAVAAGGGIIYEAGKELEGKVDWPLLQVATGLGGFALVASRMAQELETRHGVILRWTNDDKPASLTGSLGIAMAIGTAGNLLVEGFLTSRRSLTEYLGGHPGQVLVSRLVNLAFWGVGAAAVYSFVVQRLSRLNHEVEVHFSTPPSNEYVSGGPNSISPFEELGLQGRRFVTEVVPTDQIDEAMGEEGAMHPIRVYVGVESEPLYSTGRSELALEEMDRLGAFDRKYLLLVSPTGTGWVDHTVVETAEILSRGDIATVAIQYGKAPSFLETQGVSLGRAQFRQLLWGVRQRLIGVEEEEKPRVLVFGESLGAWSSSDVLMHQGIAGFDHYGIENALWFGLPGLAKWSRTGMREGRNPLTPKGTVAAFDRYEQYQALSEETRRSLRAVIVDHDNDPISQLSLRLAVKKPPWLNGEARRNVPDGMRWEPLITFIQIVADAMNATVMIPGEYKSFGHDYRADTLDFVNATYDFPSITAEQAIAIHETLVRRELSRAARIRAKEPGEIPLPSDKAKGSIQ